jgi:CRP-like cAMP-binding protein
LVSSLLNESNTRTRDVINNLDYVLKYRVKSFAAFNFEKRIKMCKVMRYEYFPKGKLICREGQRANNFYFILSGKIEIFQMKDGIQRTRVNVINSGESIGRIQLVNDIRMASIATLAPTEFLAIDKKEYASVAQTNSPEKLEEQLQTLRNLPHFIISEAFLNETLALFDISIYSANDVIVNQGLADENIHFVLSGSCRSKKTVQFIMKKTAKGTDYKAYTEGSNLVSGEVIVQRTFDLQVFEVIFGTKS